MRTTNEILRDEVDGAVESVDEARDLVELMDGTAPRMPLRASYQGSLGQAALFLRKAAEALEEAKGFLPSE